MRRVRQVPRYARSRAVRALNAGLGRLETRGADGTDEPLPHAPLFVVGAPRSGSTLLYQLLVVHYDVAYLSNLHCRLPGAAALVERTLGRRLAPPAVFSSRHGRTEGLAAPSECGPYWYRFFRKTPQYVPLEEADRERLHRLRASVRAVSAASGRTPVFKNLLNTLRLRPLAAALPEALFVVVSRDPAENAVSILAARRAVHGDEAAWWSAEPPNLEELRRLPPAEQAAGQVQALSRLVEEARAGEIGDRFHDVAYEELCADVHGTLAALARFAEARGARLPVRAPVPGSFERHGAGVAPA